ncbi:MAG TPA: VanZ family protein [Tahibacter sp.]|nr:VanZ family protein [Tahibacter sp.]
MPALRIESLRPPLRRIARALQSPATTYTTLAAAFSLLLVPLPELPDAMSPLVNGAHIPLFALIGLLMRSRFPARAGWWADLATIAIGAAIGAGGELLQYWVPGRYPSIGDELLDLVGLPLGIAVYRLLILPWRTDS